MTVFLQDNSFGISTYLFQVFQLSKTFENSFLIWSETVLSYFYLCPQILTFEINFQFGKKKKKNNTEYFSIISI